MLCCDYCCGNMSKRDYKVATTDGIELEPLGGEKLDKDKEKENKEKQTNGVTFGAESSGGRQIRNGVAVCSQKRALLVAGIVLGCLLLTALIIAFAGPSSDCPCARKLPTSLTVDDENITLPFNPIATSGEPFPWLNLTLPTDLRPLKYMVTIHPNLTTLDVKGQVTIELFVEKETNFIVLHAQDLNVTDKAIVTNGPKSSYTIKINKVLEYPPRQQLYIELKEKLKKRYNYTLNLRWYSKLNPKPEGFYVDQYQSINGVEKLLAATVFRPNGARHAFPCFDEPHIRAPFRISVFRDRFHIGLSNSIVHTTEDVGFYMGTGLLRDDFIETPPLPADAIAWVVSDFQRESLQPSPAYLPTTPPSHLNGAGGGRKPFDIQLKQKKPPVRNITALTQSLSINMNLRSNATINLNTTIKPINMTTMANFGMNDDELSKNLTALSQSTIYQIKRAPSYTFYAPKDLLSCAAFILHTSRDVLEYMQMWLEVSYPLNKVDFVALPSLDRNIISSLGLITLKTSFLTQPNSVTTEQYQQSTVLVAEAIVRQFFGGITSRKQLKDIWLWEGLVKYLGIHILSPLQENWPLREMYLINMITSALDIDAIQGWDSIINGTTSHVGNNEEFFIQKTAAIFSMLHTAIGEDRFRSCLGAFLKLHRFKTAEPLDLWNICTKKANNIKNIKDMMSLWTHQSGFPLLILSRVGNRATISQQSFQPAEFLAIHDDTYDGNNYSKAIASGNAPLMAANTINQGQSKKIKWIFPITFITNVNNHSQTLWLYNYNVTFNVAESVKWIKINAKQSGYYRVLYNEDNWSNITEMLLHNPHRISSEDRLGLLSDAFTLCHANLLSCEITMNMIQYLSNETHWGPMSLALNHLEKWRRILKYSECFLMLSEFIKMKLSTIIEKIGWRDEGDERLRLMRPEVLLASVLWEDIDSVAKSKNILNQFLFYNGTTIPPNLREVVYTGSILSGEYIYWQHCWERFVTLQRTSESYIERMQLLRALGRTKDAWLQNRLLSHVTMLPTNEVVQVLKAIAGTPTGGAMACRFLQAKWYDLESRLGQGTTAFAKVISAITQYGATKFDYDELNSLVHRFGKGPGLEILNMTLSSVAANVEWVARSQISLYKWVEGHLHTRR